ncbi:MAG: hypothetical protein AB7L90_21570 [Hyphomicrobiaceae bacterium]
MIGINPDCPPGVALLADHLDATLAAGEDLLASSLPARADLDETDPQGAPEALDAFVHQLSQLEASLVLRLLQARRLATEFSRADVTLRSTAALFRAQTDTLHDMIAGAGRSADGALVRAGDSHAYIRSRGMIAPEAAAPSPFEALSVDEGFLVGGVVQLRQILDFVSTMLDLLDVRFSLYMPDLPDEAGAPAGTAEAEKPGEAGPAPKDSLASVLGMVRAASAKATDEASGSVGSEAHGSDAETEALASNGADGAEMLDVGGLAAADEDADSATVRSQSPAEEADEAGSEAPRASNYRSLTSLIAEVQSSTDRL